MEAYTGFAYVYDEFMHDMPYSDWADLIKSRLEDNKIMPGNSQLAELGCGTGAFTIELAKRGYSILGIDNSEDMLAVADEKLYGSNEDARHSSIIYTLQDISEFDVPYELDGIISVCDTMNYLTAPGSLAKCFCSVYRALRGGGVFIFDMKKEEFYRETLADNTFSECRDDCAYIWDNYYDEETHVNEYNLTIFARSGDGRYERYDECHRQRAYDKDYVIGILQSSGFTVVREFEHRIGDGNSERMYFTAVKPQA